METSKLPVPDKKRKRASWFAPVNRCYVRSRRAIVRWLSVSRYDDHGNERHYIFRLPANDQRPLGLCNLPASKGYSDTHRQRQIDIYATLPIGMWIEMVYEFPDMADEAKPAAQLLLMEKSPLTGGAS